MDQDTTKPVEHKFDYIPPGWHARDKLNIERTLDNGYRAVIHRYPDDYGGPNCRYCWIVERGIYRVSNATGDFESALGMASNLLEGNEQVIRNLYIAYLQDDVKRFALYMSEVSQKLEDLGIKSDDAYTIGHQDGYLKGCADERAALFEIASHRIKRAS